MLLQVHARVAQSAQCECTHNVQYNTHKLQKINEQIKPENGALPSALIQCPCTGAHHACRHQHKVAVLINRMDLMQEVAKLYEYPLLAPHA